MRFVPIALVVLVVAAAAVFVGSQLGRAGSLPRGPLEPVWDQEICAHCRMHVGEPPFAAQVQMQDGQVSWFDDPGCALVVLARHDGVVHAIYFHHVREPRWVAAEAVGFVPVEHSPMGYGLGAVDAAEATITLEQARQRAAEGGMR